MDTRFFSILPRPRVLSITAYCFYCFYCFACNFSFGADSPSGENIIGISDSNLENDDIVTLKEFCNKIMPSPVQILCHDIRGFPDTYKLENNSSLRTD